MSKKKKEYCAGDDHAVATDVVKVVNHRVSNEAFVKAYVAAKSNAELAAVLGLSKTSVYSRSTKLRKAGVSLAKYDRAKKELDVRALNAIVAGL